MKTVGRSGEILVLIILHISYDNNNNNNNNNNNDTTSPPEQINSQSDKLHWEKDSIDDSDSINQ